MLFLCDIFTNSFQKFIYLLYFIYYIIYYIIIYLLYLYINYFLHFSELRNSSALNIKIIIDKKKLL